jgi:hypothetical protein
MKKIFFAALLALSAALLSAQTAAELERVLALPAVSYGDAAWLVLGAAGTAIPENSLNAAYRFAADNNWLPKKAAAGAPATLGAVSFLVMRVFNIKGGLLYTLFPGPRYAYRELVYRRLIQGRAYSSMPVSGERLSRMISRVLDYTGDIPGTGLIPDMGAVPDAEATPDTGSIPAAPVESPPEIPPAVPVTPPPALPRLGDRERLVLGDVRYSALPELDEGSRR